MFTGSALLSFFLLLPPVDVCAAQLETATRYAEFMQGAEESAIRQALWSNLLDMHHAGCHAQAVWAWEEAMYLLASCDVNEPNVHGWPAPIRVSVVPARPEP